MENVPTFVRSPVDTPLMKNSSLSLRSIRADPDAHPRRDSQLPVLHGPATADLPKQLALLRMVGGHRHSLRPLTMLSVTAFPDGRWTPSSPLVAPHGKSVMNYVFGGGLTMQTVSNDPPPTGTRCDICGRQLTRHGSSLDHTACTCRAATPSTTTWRGRSWTRTIRSRPTTTN